MSEFLPTASVDGVISPLAEACIPVTDRGFLYGDSIYEVFRTYRGIPLFLEEHWQRFENSARLIHMDLGDARERLTEDIKAATAASHARDAGIDVYVRYIVTRGGGPIDLLPTDALSRRRIVIVKEVPAWKQEHYSNGADVAVVSTRRNPQEALDPNIKGGNYLNNVLAVIEAHKMGADDCLMLSESGLITEASNSNVFFVVDGKLVTPSQKATNLRGITKMTVQSLCAAHGIAAEETEISPDDAMRASECFLSSATREIMPVASLRISSDVRVGFPRGGGEVTREVARLYRAAIDDYVASHQQFSIF